MTTGARRHRKLLLFLQIGGCEDPAYEHEDSLTTPAVSGVECREASRTVKGYEVLRGAVPESARDAVLRRIHRYVVSHGLPPEWLAEWLWNAHWFPQLKWEPEVVGLLDHLPDRLRDGELCDPQILLHLPDEGDEFELTSHVDRVPDWADSRPYLRIVGVALSPNDRRNGGLVVWPLDGAKREPVDLVPGDVLVMDPQLPHSSSYNHTGNIRYCVYFRFLEKG
jgi:hypothetical protein